MASRVTSQPLKKYFSRSKLLWDQLRSCLSPKRRWSYWTLGFKTYSELTCLSLKNTWSVLTQSLPMIYRPGITRNKSPFQKSQSLCSVTEFQILNSSMLSKLFMFIIYEILINFVIFFRNNRFVNTCGLVRNHRFRKVAVEFNSKWIFDRFLIFSLSHFKLLSRRRFDFTEWNYYQGSDIAEIDSGATIKGPGLCELVTGDVSYKSNIIRIFVCWGCCSCWLCCWILYQHWRSALYLQLWFWSSGCDRHQKRFPP